MVSQRIEVSRNGQNMIGIPDTSQSGFCSNYLADNFIRAPQAPAWEVQRTAGAVVGAIGTSGQAKNWVFSAGTRS